MGSGIGAVEMHALFPHALVVGGDVSLASLPQPVPPTCVFVRANVLEGLPFPDGQFTSTHQRLLVAAIPAHAWPGVVQELVRVTRPGGWIELVEASDVFQPAGPATRRLLDWFAGISRLREAVPVTTRLLASASASSSASHLVDGEAPSDRMAGRAWATACQRIEAPGAAVFQRGRASQSAASGSSAPGIFLFLCGPILQTRFSFPSTL
uniref:Methyltransferase type 11 domain-containing protein n=1 Tax=Thermogemmatispora argillosa TaxID=2045280 RepID=A0A455T494_9CHLR|nr:hypothetical protein KTA_04130 [Thermogemmatispora argillosa]